MKKPTDGNRTPSTKCRIAAITGNNPAVAVQDETGSQIIVTSKMARVLSAQLSEMADIADGCKITEPQPVKKVKPEKVVPFIRPTSGLLM